MIFKDIIILVFILLLLVTTVVINTQMSIGEII